jgi:hypothetical protein
MVKGDNLLVQMILCKAIFNYLSQWKGGMNWLTTHIIWQSENCIFQLDNNLDHLTVTCEKKPHVAGSGSSWHVGYSHHNLVITESYSRIVSSAQ